MVARRILQAVTEGAAMELDIRYCTSADGVRIAYEQFGDGAARAEGCAGKVGNVHSVLVKQGLCRKNLPVSGSV